MVIIVMVNLDTKLDKDTRRVLVDELRRNNFLDLAGRVEEADDGLLVNSVGREDFWLLVRLYNEGVISVGRRRRRRGRGLEGRV